MPLCSYQGTPQLKGCIFPPCAIDWTGVEPARHGLLMDLGLVPLSASLLVQGQ